MTNYEKFEAALTAAYTDAFVSDPNYAYVAKQLTPAQLADRMTKALSKGNALLTSAPALKAVARQLGVKYTSKALIAFLAA